MPPEETAKVVRVAFEAGYRHIDTAQMYHNEQGVGEAVRSSGLAREEVFVTSKLSNAWHRPDDARRAFDETLAALGLEYVDLFLIHWPLPTRFDGDYVSTWRTFEGFKREGRARSTGVSNFETAHLERLAAETGDRAGREPDKRSTLTCRTKTVRAYGREHGILTQAWAPLAQGKALTDPVIMRVAERIGRTPAQVVLRWHIRRGDVVFPSRCQRRGCARTSTSSVSSWRRPMSRPIEALAEGEAGRIARTLTPSTGFRPT